MYKHPHVKALVSATRGEGFGLPLLEAAACDLPVIATGWSAHTEFLGLGRYVDLPCTLQTVPKERLDNRIFMPGAKWAEVSEQDFKRRVRKFRTSVATPREWAKELGVKIREKYSQDAIASAWSVAFDDVIRKAAG
jgi:glycosyltransferase involved in cell wall biosynthesis